MDAFLEGRNYNTVLISLFRVGAAIYTPIDVLKCKAQATKNENPSYRKLIPYIVETEGYRGLYRGVLVQTMRDIPSWGSFFYSYEVFKVITVTLD